MITFCKVNDPYGCLSNFSKHPIVFDKLIYPTSEHFYQSLKFQDPKIRESIRMMKTPFAAACLGRSTPDIVPNWDDIKVDVMYKVCMLKLEQHPIVRETLLSTGNEEIWEYSNKDKFWGSGPDFSGRNELGKVWMRIRDELHKKDSFKI